MKLKKSLQLKIMSLFLTILTIFALTSIWSIINFNSLSKSIDNIMESNYRSIEAAQYMVLAIERQDSAELAYMFSKNEETKKIFNENEKLFITWLARAESNITEKGEKEILDRINENYVQYISNYKELSNFNREEDSEVLNRYYYEEILPLFEDTKSASRDLLSINQNAMLARKERAHDIAIKATISTVGISLASILASLVIVTLLTNRLIKPLSNLIGKIKKVSEGNYDQKIVTNREDEIGQLAEEFNNMAEKLVSYDEQSISNLHQEKNRSEAIVNSISDGILVLDHEHRIILLNAKAEEIFGIRQSEVTNKHLLEIIKNEKLFDLFKRVNEHPYDQSYKKYEDLEFKIKNVVNYFKVSVRPIRMKTGDSYGMVALFQNITKFKEIDQMKSDFISTVSHEFRTPLTSITMGVGLLLEEVPGDLTEDQKELVEAIREDSQRLSKLVGELLDLSKLESGRMHLDFQPHKITEILESMENLFRLQLEDIDAKLEFDVPENLRKIKIDIDKMSWVISNLISNAIRYLPKDGRGRIQIKVKEVYNNQVISVHDNGSGISEEIQRHIFEKFIQGKKNVGGAGLGLAISKEIVKAHGGDIWVESKPNQGTTFFFSVSTIENA